MTGGRLTPVRSALVAGTLVVAVSGTAALWHRDTDLGAGIATTGDFVTAAHWAGAPPDWAAFLPGESRQASLVVANHGAGDTLRWRFAVESVTRAEFDGHVTFEALAGACEDQPVSPVGTPWHPADGGLAAGEEAVICVRYTLHTDAPSTLQGQPVEPRITITGIQAGG